MKDDLETNQQLLSTNPSGIDCDTGDDFKRQGNGSDPYEGIVYSDCVNDKKTTMGNILGWFDYHDRLYSRMFSTIDYMIFNILFGFFAWIFNRKQCLLQIPIFYLICWFNPEIILKHLNHGDVSKDKLSEATFRLNLGLFLFIYVLLSLTVLIVFLILPLKAYIGRERPTRITSVFRFLNMRDLEHGKAMPSGDAAAGAYFLGMYLFMLG